VRINVEMSEAGIFQCGVYASSADSPATLFNVISQGHKTSSVATKTTLLITGLIASSDYKLFCLTKSSDNVLTTSYSRMMENEMSFSTLCCRHITATLVTKDVSSELDTLDVLTIEWEALPSVDFFVNLTTNYRFNASYDVSNISYPFLPSNLLLRSTRKAASFSAGIPRDSTPGEYLLDFQINSWDDSEVAKYELVYVPTAPILSVIDLYEPPTPNVTDSYFSDDGVIIYIFFDSQTDRAYQGAGLFDCSTLLVFPGASLAQCVWETRSLLYVYCDLDNALKVGDKVSLVADTLKAKCTNTAAVCEGWGYSSGSVEYTIATALDAVVPTPNIDAASKIGSCDQFILDLSLAGGSGGREWNPLNITVTSPNGYGVTDLQNFYDNVYQESPPTPAGIHLFQLRGIYEFEVSVCNFLGKCSITGDYKHTVEYEAVTRPIAYILGEAQALFAKNKLSVKCVAYVRNCDGDLYDTDSNFFIANSESTAGLSYSWSVTKDGVEDSSLSSILSASTGPELFLPSYSLTVGSVYVAIMSVTYDLTGFSTVDTLDISIKSDDIVAIIDGGKQVTLPMGTSTFLDGSLSFDGDIDPKVSTGVDVGLSFEWTCFLSSPLDTEGCGVIIETQASADKIKITPIDDISFDYINSTSTITLTAFDDSGRRPSTATVEVTIVAGDAPVITLSAEATRILPSDKLKLFSNIEIESSTAMVWSVDNPTVNAELSDIALTPLNRLELSQGIYQFNLVLKESVLPIRGTLTFSLVAGPSKASIEIIIISPPVPGRLVISPDEGEEMADTFDIGTSLWTDLELPITYAFGYVTLEGTKLPVQPRSEDTYTATTLPAGIEKNEFLQTVYVRAFNPLEASDSLKTTAKVTKTVATAEKFSAIVTAQLTEADGETDSSVVKKIVNVASSSMNNVNCTLAPNCTALNRGECFKLAGTCGECKTNFVGEDGHDNSMCFAFRNTSGVASDASCSADSDCQLFQECNTATSTCFFPPKSCKFDCNNRGNCTYKNVKTGDLLDTCARGDTSCVARCSCDTGYAGDICQNSQAEQDAKLKAREDMANALSDAVSNEPLNTPDAVQDLIGMIEALSANPHELSVAACDSLAGLVQKAIDGIATLDMQYEDLAAIYQTLDDCQTVYIDNGVIIDLNGDGNDGSGRRILASTGALNTLMNEYVGVVSNGIEGGQDLVGEASANYRTSNYFSSNEQYLTFNVEQTDAEIAANAPKSVIYVSLGSNGANSEVSTALVESVYQMYSSSDDNAIIGNPLRAQFSRSTIDGMMSLEFHLVNVVGAVEYGGIRTSNETLTTNCRKGRHFIDSYNCSSGYLLQNECLGNSTASHQLISNCPNSTYLPVCGLIMGGAIYASNPDPLGNVSCSTQSYTNMSVVCECTMYLGQDSTDNTRRRLASEEANTIEVAPVATYVADGTVNTVYVITEVLESENWIIITMVICLWSVGLLLAACFMMKCCHDERKKDKTVAINDDYRMDDIAKTKESVIQSYVDSLFPAVFAGESKWSWAGVKSELRSHHRHFSIFFGSETNNEMKRVVNVLELLTLHTTVFFFVGVFFVAQWPVDDAADKYFNAREAICALFFITVIHVIFSIPLNIIFQDYIYAPSAEVEAAAVREADYHEKQSSIASPNDKMVSLRLGAKNGGNDRDNFFQKYVCRWETTRCLPESHVKLRKDMSALGAAGRLTAHSETGLPIKDSNDQPFDYSQLVNIINDQRVFIKENKPDAMDLFDEKWGLKKEDLSDKMEFDVDRSILVSNMKSMKLHLAKKENIGVEIMHEFIVDLLGRDTNEAMIFLRKTEEDFQHLNVVSKMTRALAILVVLGLNIFFLYYTISLGIHRSKDFQLNFVTVCMFQLLLEFALFDTLEVFWVQYYIPRMVLSRVQGGVDRLRELLMTATMPMSQPLNAPDYLFVSTRLARSFPTLLESELVRLFSSDMPGAIGDRWTRSSSWIPHNLSSDVGVRFFIPELVLMQYIGTLTMRAQKAIVRLFLPVMILLLLVFIAFPVLFVIAAIILIALLLLHIYLMSQKKKATVIHVHESPPPTAPPMEQEPVDELEQVAPLPDKMKPVPKDVESPPPVEEPKVEPKHEEVDEPKVEEPKIEEPKIEEPKVEEPKKEEPKADIFDEIVVKKEEQEKKIKKKKSFAKYALEDNTDDGQELPPIKTQGSNLLTLADLPPLRVSPCSKSNSLEEKDD